MSGVWSGKGVAEEAVRVSKMIVVDWAASGPASDKLTEASTPQMLKRILAARLMKHLERMGGCSVGNPVDSIGAENVAIPPTI